MDTQTSELLVGLNGAEIDTILALGTPVRLSAGDVLFRLGEQAGAVYLVRSGRISLSLPMQIGGVTQDVFLEERLPGQALGWSALIPPYRFTLKAAAPLATDLLALPREVLLAHFEQRPQAGYLVALNIATIIGSRLQVVQAMWLRQMQQLVNTHA